MRAVSLSDKLLTGFYCLSSSLCSYIARQIDQYLSKYYSLTVSSNITFCLGEFGIPYTHSDNYLRPSFIDYSSYLGLCMQFLIPDIMN